MNAYTPRDTRNARPRQIGVPEPHRVEQTPDFLEALAKALEAQGDSKKAASVRRHAMGYYRLFTCSVGHISARPDICGHHLCAWCRWHQLNKWAESMTNKAGRETYAYKFEVVFDFKPDSLDSIKSVLKRTMLPHGGSPAFGIQPAYDIQPALDNSWELVVVVTGLNPTGRNEALSAFQAFALLPTMAWMRSLPLDKLGEELDWVMPHLGDYIDRDDKLHEYLGMDLGNRLLSEHVGKPQNSDMDGPVNPPNDESEDSDAIFGTGVQGSSPPTTSSLKDQNEDAPKITPVSYCSQNAIDVGPDCLKCGRPTTVLGLYRLEYGEIVKVHGTGPDKIPPGEVLEPSGELRLRLSYD